MGLTKLRSTRVPLLCSATAPIILLSIIIFVGQISSNYNPISDTISQMGASNNPYAVVLNASYVVYGMLMCYVAYGFYSRFNYSNLAKVMAILITVHAIGYLFLAIFPDSPDFPGKPFTKDILHNSFSVLVSLALLAWILVFNIAARREKVLKVAATFGIIVVIVSLPLPLTNVFELFEPISGLLQRIIVGLSFFWISLTSLLLIKKPTTVEVAPS